MPPLTRRDLVRLSAGAALASVPALRGQGLIIRQKSPENLEFPFSSLDSWITPNDRFYIRSHFAVPKLDGSSHRLKVEGAVDRPLDLSLSELNQLGTRSTLATLECAGNSRVYLIPAAPGVQWEHGAVSNAEWTGVPLSTVLQRAGVRNNAADVIFEGADSGEIRTDPRPPGNIHFMRSLPLKKALSDEVLLVTKMNGQDLPVSHGYPLRLVVPGYYGMASVKWLQRVIVSTEQFRGYYQTIDYAYWNRALKEPTRMPLLEMRIKSAIARPAMTEIVPAGKDYRVFGAAWAGEADVAKVEISADGGQTWSAAKLLDSPKRFAWRFWEHSWKAPVQAGRYSLTSRATDSQGRVQPTQHDQDYGQYAIHHTVPTDVLVR